MSEATTHVAASCDSRGSAAQFYELRFPRITKVYRSNERSCTDGTTLDEFQCIAREAVGHESSTKDVEDWCNELWGKPSAPGVKCPVKRKRTEAEWEQKLEEADRRAGKKTKTSKTGAGSRHLRSHPDDSGEENTRGPLPDSPKSPRLVKALGSMTNLTVWSPQADSGEGAAPAGLSVVPASVTHPLPSPPPTTKPSHHRHQPFRGKATIIFANNDRSSPSPSSPTRGSANPHLDATLRPLRSAGDTLTNDSDSAVGVHPVESSRNAGAHLEDPSNFNSTPLGQFLQDAVVWLATPGNAPRPAWRVPSKLIFPVGQQVHSLEAVLQACNWRTGGCGDICDWAKKGVIFVDDTPEAQETGAKPWTEYPLKKMTERRSTLLRANEEVNSKTIWVFSVGMLSYEALRDRCPDASVEARALCRFA